MLETDKDLIFIYETYLQMKKISWDLHTEVKISSRDL